MAISLSPLQVWISPYKDSIIRLQSPCDGEWLDGAMSGDVALVHVVHLHLVTLNGHHTAVHMGVIRLERQRPPRNMRRPGWLLRLWPVVGGGKVFVVRFRRM